MSIMSEYCYDEAMPYIQFVPYFPQSLFDGKLITPSRANFLILGER